MELDEAECLTIEKGNVLIKFPDDMINKLKKIERVCDQAEGALHLIFNESNCDNWSQRNDVDKNEKMKLCLLRCALSEIVGIEDALRKYYENNNIFRLYDTKDPIIHFIRELRNFEIHIKETKISKHNIKVIYDGEVVTYKGSEVSINIDYLHIDLGSFKKLKNYNLYTLDQWSFMKDKFDKLQMNWGYQEVIIGAVEKYCTLLVDHYKL